jgi:hypothetical protein
MCHTTIILDRKYYSRMKKDYGGVIWTNHVLERLKERGIKQGDAFAAFNRPDSSKFDKKKSVWVYKRAFDNKEFEVVAKKEESPPAQRASGSARRWVIISVWDKDLY